MSRERIADLIEEWEPRIRDAFLASIDDLRSRAEIGRIATLLERGDINGALEAVHLDSAAFRDLDEALTGSFNAGGVSTINNLPPLREPGGGLFVVRFDARNIEAENWLRNHSSQLVTRIVDDQRQAIRTALSAGMERGDNPRTVALDIVGRINRTSGRREGGIIGLTSQQERFVANALQELLSGDPEQLANYLTRARRDKRFDRTVLKAIREEKPIPRDIVAKMIGRYKDSLLKLRGDTIGRTEAMASLHGAQYQALRQAIASGAVREQDVRRVWRSASDTRVRDSHRNVNGESVGLAERFSNGLLYPGEPGAPVEEVINCRCALDVRVDFLANIR